MKKRSQSFLHLGYRTPTWFKEKTRKKIIKIKINVLKDSPSIG